MLNTPDLWRVHYPVLKPDGNKYDRGSSLIYGGEVMTGAARLAARAAQRMGAGLVTIATPSKAFPIYAEALESVIVREANDVAAWNELLGDAKRNSILIGPGLGLGSLQAELTLAALKARKPCVLDADALSNFAGDPSKFFDKLHPDCVLTPHEGEFRKLFGTPLSASCPRRRASVLPQETMDSRLRGNDAGLVDAEHTNSKCERALQAAKRANCIVLLKGAETVIAAPNGDYVVNNNAPPWLATAGAGDVLAGMILGLVAQKMPVFWAAAAAAWIHGDIASAQGQGMIAEDLVEGIRTYTKSHAPT